MLHLSIKPVLGSSPSQEGVYLRGDLTHGGILGVGKERLCCISETECCPPLWKLSEPVTHGRRQHSFLGPPCPPLLLYFIPFLTELLRALQSQLQRAEDQSLQNRRGWEGG